jgi:hypothetical protein
LGRSPSPQAILSPPSKRIRPIGRDFKNDLSVGALWIKAVSAARFHTHRREIPDR